jgi:hypothetical protein
MCDFLCAPLQGVNLLAICLHQGGSLQIRDIATSRKTLPEAEEGLEKIYGSTYVTLR